MIQICQVGYKVLGERSSSKLSIGLGVKKLKGNLSWFRDIRVGWLVQTDVLQFRCCCYFVQGLLAFEQALVLLFAIVAPTVAFQSQSVVFAPVIVRIRVFSFPAKLYVSTIQPCIFECVLVDIYAEQIL